MKDNYLREEEEIHPFLPSGDWTGFYCYHNSPQQHKMSIELTFANLKVKGSGIDDIASFTWQGVYDLASFKVNMTKYYSSHHIQYLGTIDENGIWGIWNFYDEIAHFPPGIQEGIKLAFKEDLTGGFHIWPTTKGLSVESNSLEESTILKENKHIVLT